MEGCRRSLQLGRVLEQPVCTAQAFSCVNTALCLPAAVCLDTALWSVRMCAKLIFIPGKKIAPETGIYRTEGAGGGRWLSEHSIRGSDCCVWLRWRVPV